MHISGTKLSLSSGKYLKSFPYSKQRDRQTEDGNFLMDLLCLTEMTRNSVPVRMIWK